MPARLLGIVFLVFAGCGNNLLEVVESKVAAANGLTVDFQYSGPYEFSADYPVILKFFPTRNFPHRSLELNCIRYQQSSILNVPALV